MDCKSAADAFFVLGLLVLFSAEGGREEESASDGEGLIRPVSFSILTFFLGVSLLTDEARFLGVREDLWGDSCSSLTSVSRSCSLGAFLVLPAVGALLRVTRFAADAAVLVDPDIGESCAWRTDYRSLVFLLSTDLPRNVVPGGQVGHLPAR